MYNILFLGDLSIWTFYFSELLSFQLIVKWRMHWTNWTTQKSMAGKSNWQKKGVAEADHIEGKSLTTGFFHSCYQGRWILGDLERSSVLSFHYFVLSTLTNIHNAYRFIYNLLNKRKTQHRWNSYLIHATAYWSNFPIIQVKCMS